VGTQKLYAEKTKGNEHTIELKGIEYINARDKR
jgi:hypothetical protein